MASDTESGTSQDSAPVDYAGLWPRLAALFIDVILLVIVSWGIANVVYFIGFWAWRGQTLGQLALNIRVVKTDGSDVDLRAAVLRFLGYILCFVTLGIGFLVSVFDAHRQGLHDKIADTYVVRSPRR